MVRVARFFFLRMRINRYLASAGLGSRRACEALVAAGRVTINGEPCTTLAARVADGDRVRVDGRVVQSEAPLYLLLHKPKGFLCTADDEGGRRTIFDLLPPDLPRVFHVGRLDKESEGLLLLTNDGELALKLTHPSHRIEKEYEVMLDRNFDPVHKAKLLKGFRIEGGRARMESIRVLGPRKLRVVLSQGIKRQIRLMFYDCGYEVDRLVRIRIGSLWIERMRAGEHRPLSGPEVEALRRSSVATQSRIKK